MAILNFPNTGLYDGYQWTGDNGVTYIYDGIKWVGHAVAQPAGTSSITNNGNTLQIDPTGNIIIPTGAFIYYESGEPLSDRLISGGEKVILGADGILTIPGEIAVNNIYTLDNVPMDDLSFRDSTHVNIEILKTNAPTLISDIHIGDTIAPTNDPTNTYTIDIAIEDGGSIWIVPVTTVWANALTSFNFNFVGGSSTSWAYSADGNLTLPGNSDITVPDATESARYGKDIRIQGVRGYGNWSTNNVTGYAGEGSSIKLTAGRGGESADIQGGEGGAVDLVSGNGNGGGYGGTIRLTGGDAEWNSGGQQVYGGNIQIHAGNAVSQVQDVGVGGNVNITAGQGTLRNGYVNVQTNGGSWNFDSNGSLNSPNGYTLNRGQQQWINAGSAPTVVYTSEDGTIGSIKATIKVYVRQADNIDGDHDEDTQVCEMLVATKRRFIDNGGLWIKTAVASVYGVTHTSDTPLATFTVNFVENLEVGPGIFRDVVQILAEPTAAVTGQNIWVTVAATEMTND
jgi:hypothetical protein